MIPVEDICSARKRLGLSQEKLAEALGVSRNTISRWERGEFHPTADKLATLEQLLIQLEEGPAVPEDTPVPEETATLKEATVPPPVVPTKAKHWPMVLLCAGVLCALLIGILSLINIYSIKQQLDPADSAISPIVDESELDGREMDNIPVVPATRQPLEP